MGPKRQESSKAVPRSFSHEEELVARRVGCVGIVRVLDIDRLHPGSVTRFCADGHGDRHPDARRGTGTRPCTRPGARAGDRHRRART